jgi:hypothetical protein
MFVISTLHVDYPWCLCNRKFIHRRKIKPDSKNHDVTRYWTFQYWPGHLGTRYWTVRDLDETIFGTDHNCLVLINCQYFCTSSFLIYDPRNNWIEHKFHNLETSSQSDRDDRALQRLVRRMPFATSPVLKQHWLPNKRLSSLQSWEIHPHTITEPPQ